MFNTAIIEVVVGLVFVFSLMAILVTQINSLIIFLLNMRAKELKAGIQDLITDERIQAKILAHPSIKMVKESIPPGTELTAALADNIVNSRINRVDYVPPAAFVEALVGVLVTDTEGGLYNQLQMAINALPSSVEKSQLRELVTRLKTDFSEETIREMHRVIGQMADISQRNALMAGVQQIEKTLADLGIRSNQLVPLLNGVHKIDNPYLKSALESMLVTAQNIGDASKKLESWFNEGMGRVTTTFQRHMQWYSFIVAMVLAIVLNVDALYLGRTLWEDPELRQTVATSASNYQMPEAASVIPGTRGAPSQKELQRQATEVQITIQALLELQLPVGWQLSEVTPRMIETSREVGLSDPTSNPRNLWNFLPGNNSDDKLFRLWIQKFIGILATTIAAAQGAPFWFDILRKLTHRSDS